MKDILLTLSGLFYGFGYELVEHVLVEDPFFFQDLLRKARFFYWDHSLVIDAVGAIGLNIAFMIILLLVNRRIKRKEKEWWDKNFHIS